MSTEAKLANLLQSAQTAKEVDQLLQMAAAAGSKVVPVGGRENNIGTIRMASDPGLALIERITNGLDSLLELAVLLHPGSNPQTPEAAAQLLGVPAGGVADMTDTERRTLAERLIFSLHDSGLKRRPTVRIVDCGMGQHPSKFARTLLSLNESNKVGKPFTMGTYGQGGSVTFGFSRYTIIVSRRHPDLLEPGEEDRLGWTVVFEEQTDPSKNVLPRYVWLVQPDGSPFSLPASLFPGFDHGVHVTHVEYDIQGLQGPFTTQTWQFMHSAMFEPVLPFLISGDRDNDPKKKDGSRDSRVVIGNSARLANIAGARGEIELGAHDSFKIDLGPDHGSVTADYWALVRPEGSTSKGEPAGSYVEAASAVCLTLHGQRQDTERRGWIKDRAKLPFLYKNIVVHINANGLLPAGRRELFASTRERATQSALRNLIYDRVVEELRTSEDLKALNHAEKQRMLMRSTAATNDKVRKRLAKFVQQKLKGTTKPTGTGKGAGHGPNNPGGSFHGGGSAQPGGGGSSGGGPHKPRNTDDTNLPNVPTSVVFESKRLKVKQGHSAHVWVEINAKNGYLPRHDSDLTVEITGNAGHGLMVTTRSKLLGGKSRWALIATVDTSLGEYKLHVALMTANGELTADLPIEVIAPPAEPSQPKGGSDVDAGPDVRWMTEEEWDDDWSAQVVGRVAEDDESTIIFVNKDYNLLAKTLALNTLTAEQMQVRADRYQYPIACALWLQDHQVRRMAAPPDDAYQQGELHRLAEAVLLAMDADVELAAEGGED